MKNTALKCRINTIRTFRRVQISEISERVQFWRIGLLIYILNIYFFIRRIKICFPHKSLSCLFLCVCVFNFVWSCHSERLFAKLLCISWWFYNALAELKYYLRCCWIGKYVMLYLLAIRRIFPTAAKRPAEGGSSFYYIWSSRKFGFFRRISVVASQNAHT